MARSSNFSDVKLKRGILKAKEGVRAEGKPDEDFFDDEVEDDVDLDIVDENDDVEDSDDVNLDIVAVVFDRVTLLGLEEAVDDDDVGEDDDVEEVDDGGVMVLDLGMEVVVLDRVFVVSVVVSVIVSGEGGTFDV